MEGQNVTNLSQSECAALHHGVNLSHVGTIVIAPPLRPRVRRPYASFVRGSAVGAEARRIEVDDPV
jgi:hypothetical protein